MRIGILTQPLTTNYGGLLQNYALQYYLKQKGHEPVTLDPTRKGMSFPRLCISMLKRFLLNSVKKTHHARIHPLNDERYLSQHTQHFIDTYLKYQRTGKKMDHSFLRHNHYDALIVGSDQVWRPKYSTDLPNYFLDFAADYPDVKKIAYAASFGVNEWEFSAQETETCKQLIHAFDAVAVREDSGLQLCKQYFGLEATHVLDPTLLLNKEVYVNLIQQDDIGKSAGNLMTYILDNHGDKKLALEKILKQTSLQPFIFTDRVQSTPKPFVTEWLRGFMDAEFVMTDSFHGCIFAIIFQKPFIVYGNSGRGLARFQSLLKMFGLENRLVSHSDEVTESLMKEQINWAQVNTILLKHQQIADQFITSSLK